MTRYWLLVMFFLLPATVTAVSHDELTPTVIPVVINPGEHAEVSFSPDGRVIARHPSGAIVTETQQIELWDSATGEMVYHADRINQFQWVGNGSAFFATFYDAENYYDIVDTLIYDPEQETEVVRLDGMLAKRNRSPDWLMMYHDGKTLLRHAQRLTEPIVVSDSINSFTISTTGRYIAVSDGNLKIYATDTGDLVSELDHHYYNSILFNADDTAFIVRLYRDYRLYTLTPAGAEVIARIEAEATGCGVPSSPQWFTTGTRVLFSHPGMVWDYEQDTRTPLRGISSLSPDNRWIASLSHSRLNLYDADTLEITHSWENTDSHVKWSPDSRRLVTYGYEGSAHLYDVERSVFMGQLPHYHHFEACGVYLFAPQWNPDSSQLVTYVFSNVLAWRENDRGTVRVYGQLDSLPYYAQPNETEPAGHLEQGTAFTIRGADRTGWYAFETDDGRVGWLFHAAGLVRVQPPPANTIWVWNLPD